MAYQNINLMGKEQSPAPDFENKKKFFLDFRA